MVHGDREEIQKRVSVSQLESHFMETSENLNLIFEQSVKNSTNFKILKLTQLVRLYFNK
jgi:hypothetical protein